MRAWIVVCLCLVLVAPAFAQRDYTADPAGERTDVWWDPADPGWLLTIAPSGEVSSALLADFDAAGTPRWWVGGALRDAPGRVALALYRPRWDVQQQRLLGSTLAGHLTFARRDEDHAQLTLQLEGRSRTHALVRLVVNRDYSLGDRSGFWFDPDDGGHGQMLIQQGRWIGSVSIGYDRDGEPTWAFAQGEIGAGLLDAQRVRRICTLRCQIIAEPGGQTQIQFLNQDDAIATTTLIDASGTYWQRPQKALTRYTTAPNGRVQPAALAHFGSTAAMTHFVAETTLRNPNYSSDGCIDFSAGPPSVAIGSDTNIQESGVGEHDDIKRVGDLVYSVHQPWNGTPLLRVHRLDGVHGQASALHAYPLPADTTALGLHALVRDGRTRLILLSGRSPYNNGYVDGCAGYTEPDANVIAIIYDAAPDGSLTERHRIELQGSFSTSRLIGSSLLFVSGFIVGVDGAQPRLPQWRLDNGAWRNMATRADTWLPNFAPNAYERALTTLSQFDLDALGEADFTSVFARIDASYVAPSAWYLATSEYRFGTGFAPGGDARLDIHKIALPTLDYRGTGSVAGELSVGGNDRALRFSEYAGDLRVITDHGWSWNATSLFELNVLREGGNARLTTVATLPNTRRPQPIGPPHEQAFGVRFDGDVAYAVSYYRIDPLYAIDLSDPLDPKLDSALEITGYSAYLHPLPGGHLLGVGQHTVEGSNGDAPGQFWFHGLKLSLFDQRDRSRPQESWRQIVGGRGSDSDLLRDHRAIAVAATSNGLQRVAVPMVVHDGASTDAPWVYQPWVHTGVATFDVGPDGSVSGYRLRPAVFAGSGDRSTELRSVLYGDSVFLFHAGRWYGQRIDSTTAMSGPH
jgi:hypothetical protein